MTCLLSMICGLVSVAVNFSLNSVQSTVQLEFDEFINRYVGTLYASQSAHSRFRLTKANVDRLDDLHRKRSHRRSGSGRRSRSSRSQSSGGGSSGSSAGSILDLHKSTTMAL
ncbi:hypothetical protein AK812_SmicGene16370 [Symbiodinium microadriaticum]|uniref:Uncharacterized protein n=1 Tax=Symbiodinium microadriaticum TaxID=2951 RepID=A0A1Q9E0H0_SYMMI|nr:hypothetical protein AK812_SmicGene16370 [Symbiodinium microadriaticum]